MSRRLYNGVAIGAEVLVPLAILAAWQLWTVQADSDHFPRLSTILVEFKDMWLFSEFTTHVVPSLVRIALGFAIAVVAGVAIGIPIGLSGLTRKLAMPHIEYWRAMPPPACCRSRSSCCTTSATSRRWPSSPSSVCSRSS